MALDTRHREEIFVEIFEKSEYPDGRPEGQNMVSRREDVTTYTDAQRRATAQHFAGRIDRDLYGVRLVKVVTEVLEAF